MKTITLWIVTAALLSQTSTTAIAQAVETVRFSEVAKEFCAEEWSVIEAQEQSFWLRLDERPFAIDPNLDATTTKAFNRYSASVVSLADYIATYISLSDNKNQTQQYLSVAKAKFNLAVCLVPTDTDKEIIVEFARASSESPIDDIRIALFEHINQFFCMQFDRASEQIFRLNPKSDSFSDDVASITSTTIKTCE